MDGLKRWRGVLAAVLVAVLAAGWPAPAQAAGSPLDLSLPAAHDELKQAPDAVSLFFSRRVDYDTTIVLVTNSAGKNVRKQRILVNGANVVATVADNLPKDTYTVHWRIDAPGDEVEGGAFQFAVGSGDWTDLADARWEGRKNQPEIFGDTDDFGNPSSSPSPSETPTSAAPTTSGSPTVEPPASTPVATASPLPAPAPDQGSGSGVPWTGIGVGLIVVAALGAGGVLLARRRESRSADQRRPGGEGPNSQGPKSQGPGHRA